MEISGTSWGATAAERRTAFPCDQVLTAVLDGARGYERWTRAVDVAAPAPLVYRWLLQLRHAPYSYDRIDFRGRRSPDRLPAETEPPAIGQRLLVFDLTGFEADRHLTGLLPQAAAHRYGQLAVSYVVRARGPHRSRLLVRVVNEARPRLPHRVQRRLLAWGDLVMMRKQLHTLRDLAERDARHGVPKDG